MCHYFAWANLFRWKIILIESAPKQILFGLVYQLVLCKPVLFDFTEDFSNCIRVTHSDIVSVFTSYTHLQRGTVEKMSSATLMGLQKWIIQVAPSMMVHRTSFCFVAQSNGNRYIFIYLYYSSSCPHENFTWVINSENDIGGHLVSFLCDFVFKQHTSVVGSHSQPHLRKIEESRLIISSAALWHKATSVILHLTITGFTDIR